MRERGGRGRRGDNRKIDKRNTENSLRVPTRIVPFCARVTSKHTLELFFLPLFLRIRVHFYARKQHTCLCEKARVCVHMCACVRVCVCVCAYACGLHTSLLVTMHMQ